MNAMVEAIKPYIGMIFAIWFISEVITAMFRLYRKKSYQDRRMANDAEHAKVTRAMRYDVLFLFDDGRDPGAIDLAGDLPGKFFKVNQHSLHPNR